VDAELLQAQLCILQVDEAVFSDDPEVRRCGFRWGPAVIAIQCIRQQLLVPMVTATAPLLALCVGLDALTVALNVLAVTFVLDFDEGAFQSLLSRPQRAYLETVEIHCEPYVQFRQAIVSRLVLLFVVGLCFSQIPTWNPRSSDFAANYKGIDDALPEPVASIMLFSAGVFALGQLLILGIDAVSVAWSRKNKKLSRADFKKSIFVILVKGFLSCIAAALALVFGFASPEPLQTPL